MTLTTYIANVLLFRPRRICDEVMGGGAIEPRGTNQEKKFAELYPLELFLVVVHSLNKKETSGIQQ